MYSYYLGRGNNYPLVKAWSRLTRVEGVEFVWTQGKSKPVPQLPCLRPSSNSLTAHFKASFPCDTLCTSKKDLLLNVKVYAEMVGMDPFSVLPVTFHISKGVFDPEYYKFVEYFRKISQESEKTGARNLWIVKPGKIPTEEAVFLCVVRRDRSEMRSLRSPFALKPAKNAILSYKNTSKTRF